MGYQKDIAGIATIDQTRSHNGANQIKTVDDSNSGIVHDVNGNMTQIPGGKDLKDPANKLKWDAWNHLVEVRKASDVLVAEYTYDGNYRRTTKKKGDGSIKHTYYNTDWRSVEERKSTSANPKAIHYWDAQDRWELIRRDRDSNDDGNIDESIYCIKDQIDPIGTVTWSGVVKERYTYDAFGEVSFHDLNFDDQNESSIDWNYLFHGEFQDNETGMYNYGYRYYDSRIGRWPSRDPIEESGGVNLYRVVENDSVNKLDSHGLAKTSKSIIIRKIERRFLG